MFSSLMRLFVLRPFLSIAILGIPIAILVAVGLLTIVVVKFLLLVVLPIVLVIWVFRKIFGNGERGTS